MTKKEERPKSGVVTWGKANASSKKKISELKGAKNEVTQNGGEFDINL